MTKLTLPLLLACLALVQSIDAEDVSLGLFNAWMKVHQKEYATHKEMLSKFEKFKANYDLVDDLNEMYKGKTEFALNKFADMSPEEFRSQVLMRNSRKPAKHFPKSKILPETYDDLPTSFDWRDKGAVTAVKDQGSVGTCWAHSATQNLEGLHFLKGNALTNLSVEQIVDCDGFQSDTSDDHADCGVYGGWPYLAFEFIKSVGGIASENSYPYCSGTKKPCAPCEAPGYNKTKCGPPIPYCYLADSCQAKLNASQFVPHLTVVDWKKTSENETDIALQMQQIGPLSVALNAELLQFYHKGIFDPVICDKDNLDHAVLLVGWGVEKSKIHGTQPYWIVKNSWGPSWGEHGYFRILRGKGKCGINTQVTTAILQ